MKVVSMSEVENNQAAKVVLTKDEKLTKIAKQIQVLEAKYQDIMHDRATVKKAKAVAFLPVVGQVVLATIGRNTATSKPTVQEATVVAVKVPAEGEKGSTQVRIQIGTGFDAQLVTVYPAQLVAIPEDEVPADEERPLGQLPE